MEKDLNSLLFKSRTEINNLSDSKRLGDYFIYLFGSNGTFTALTKKIKDLPDSDKPKIGRMANKLKIQLEELINDRKKEIRKKQLEEEIDITIPGINPPLGHLHLVTQAITEIRTIFERIGFNLMRYKEVEWEWYSFTSLNFPQNHPARDDLETFFVEGPANKKYGRLLLSPHTSSGQVREMERMDHNPPIRMINIAKCYRPNWDITHTPMFHQFEGLVIDKGINITHLKGTLDYFVKQFYGPKRKARIRPFHFQFTEPSFEVDVTCEVCEGKGCRVCKQGWLELGGSGMVHPNVLRAGKIDPDTYTGFAFGWGVERCLSMKEGRKLDDNRLFYENDIRFLEQF